MPTAQQQARALRAAAIRRDFADDASVRVAINALTALDAGLADLAERRRHLEETKHFTAAGVHEKLKEFRGAQAKNLTDARDKLKPAAERLLAETQPKLELPQDAQRILDHFNAAPAAKRQELMHAALDGRDDDLARVLVHPSNRRFVDLQPQVLAHMERRFADGAAVEANRPRLEALQFIHQTLSDAIAELEQE
jgi:hypothetical protein